MVSAIPPMTSPTPAEGKTYIVIAADDTAHRATYRGGQWMLANGIVAETPLLQPPKQWEEAPPVIKDTLIRGGA